MLSMRNSNNRLHSLQYNPRSISSPTRKASQILKVIIYLSLVGVGFCLGFIVAISISTNDKNLMDCPKCTDCSPTSTNTAALVDTEKQNYKCPENKLNNDNCQNGGPRFPPQMSGFMSGMARLNKTEFLNKFDYGTADTHSTHPSLREVLLLYNNPMAVPSGNEKLAQLIVDNGAETIPLISSMEATQNCDQLNVIHLSDGKSDRQCTAILGSYPSGHIHRWMRAGDPDKGQTPKLNAMFPLRHVGRGLQTNGMDKFGPPNSETTLKSWESVKLYLNEFERVTGHLKPILESIARDGTIIVMVCNHGQSPLLMNFVCSSKPQNFDLSNILVVATDAETKELAEALGLTVFYDQTLFADFPTGEAEAYGDEIFTAMMGAKVWSVHLVNWLGYNVLFQDVDLVWLRDPVPYLTNYTDYDMLFQDDGARTLRYAPYCANSGFYFVKANGRTRWLMNSLLFQFDFIKQTGSHQQALAALLAEHSSLSGLKVKTLGWEFPGGWHYHRQRTLMKDIIAKKESPYIFHMSWTTNKENKLLFFQQMGMWYVQGQCDTEENARTILKNMNRNEEMKTYEDLCCTNEPRIQCHFSDKPSVIPCNESPPIDRGGKSFWL